MITDNPHNKAFHMRLTQKEYDNLHANAKRAGLPLSTYMRFMMKACQPKEQRPVDWFKFYSQLCRIGNNLNQLTHLAHRTGSVDADMHKQFRDDFDMFIRALMEDMYLPEKLDATRIVKEAKARSRQEQ